VQQQAAGGASFWQSTTRSSLLAPDPGGILPFFPLLCPVSKRTCVPCRHPLFCRGIWGGSIPTMVGGDSGSRGGKGCWGAAAHQDGHPRPAAPQLEIRIRMLCFQGQLSPSGITPQTAPPRPPPKRSPSPVLLGWRAIAPHPVVPCIPPPAPRACSVRAPPGHKPPPRCGTRAGTRPNPDPRGKKHASGHGTRTCGAPRPPGRRPLHPAAKCVRPPEG